MLRITIEEVPELAAVPRGPARRENDLLYPQAMLEPKVKFQQAWLEGETQPNVTMLIGLLNGLDVPEVCANCGHTKDQHTGGTGVCDTHNYQYGSQSRCACAQYLTTQQAWNQATLTTNDSLNKKVHELETQVQLLQEGVMLEQIKKILPEVIAKTAELQKRKRTKTSRRERQ